MTYELFDARNGYELNPPSPIIAQEQEEFVQEIDLQQQ